MSDKTVICELRVGESMRVAGATITLREKSGQRAKLVVVAGPGTAVETSRDIKDRGLKTPAPTSF